MPKKSSNRCWPGYEPVPGKPKGAQGSCKPEAEAKLTDAEKKFRAKRKRQLAEWKRKHPNSPKKAAQHLSAPGAVKKSATKKRAAGRSRKTTSKRSTTRKS